MTDYRDWNVSIPFTVPTGDVDGEWMAALFDAAVELAPSDARGITGRADTVEGKVWISFTLIETSEELARDIVRQMRGRVTEAVLVDEDACVSAV